MLESYYAVIAIPLLLVLGVNVLLFGVTVIVPSIAVVQSMVYEIVYMQTADSAQAASSALQASLAVAGLWFIGFVPVSYTHLTLPTILLV